MCKHVQIRYGPGVSIAMEMSKHSERNSAVLSSASQRAFWASELCSVYPAYVLILPVHKYQEAVSCYHCFLQHVGDDLHTPDFSRLMVFIQNH